MFQRKTKCEVCGQRFTPTKETVYIAEEPRSALACLTEAPTRFSMVDCPRCGCQIMLGVRYPRIDLVTDEIKQGAQDESGVAEDED